MSLTHESPINIEQIEKNFAEINPLLSAAEAVFESNRCLYCFDAPCTHACPTHIDVPSFIKKIASGNLLGSARVIFDANPIGATCARVCPVEVLCEGACVEKTLMDKPIEIGRLQRYATDYAMNSGRKVYQAGAPNGKSVAVVGSGPAGLSCATYLARLGHAVTVFDRKSLPGGLDTYGMAEYKITQAVSVEEAKQVADLGVEFRLNTEIIASAVESGANGETPENETSAEKHVIFGDLIKEFDAVFVGIGLGATNRLNVAGEDSTGVIDALDFIERIKTREWRTVPIAGTVAVIGAGNTAIDAVTQAKRLGAERVLMVYRRTERDISAYKYEYELAKKDGVEFVWQAAPIEVVANENGAVAALRCERTDGSRQIFEIKCEMIVKAIGQRKQVDFLKPLGIETDEKGRVLVDLETMQTSNSKIFAGGDCVNGGREAVDAAQTGKLAAQGIHHALTGERIEFAGARLPFLEKAIVQIHATPVPAAFDEPAIPAEDLGIKSYG